MIEYAARLLCLNGKTDIAIYSHTTISEFWKSPCEVEHSWSKFIKVDTVLIKTSQIDPKIVCVCLHTVTLILDKSTKKNNCF